MVFATWTANDDLYLSNRLAISSYNNQTSFQAEIRVFSTIFSFPRLCVYAPGEFLQIPQNDLFEKSSGVFWSVVGPILNGMTTSTV